MKVCIFGLGEAGSLFADDLVAAGAEVTAYDPADVPTPDGVLRRAHPALAVRRAEVVLALTSQADARLAFLQALDAVDRSALYADLSTSSPQIKAELAELAMRRSLDFADVAMLSMVPGHGLMVPSMVCGPGAERYSRILGSFGGEIETISGPAGTASAKKLARSVMMKGVAAVLVEAVEAGAAADDLAWLWSNVTAELRSAGDDWARRMVTGSKQHARRRMHEMESAAEMLGRLGTPTTMTEATIASLRRLIDTDLPDLPPAPSPDAETAVEAGAGSKRPSSRRALDTSAIPKPERPSPRKPNRPARSASKSKPKPAAAAERGGARGPIVTDVPSPTRADPAIDPGVPTAAIDSELDDELLLAGPLVAGELDNPPSDEAVDAAIDRIKAILDEEENQDPDDEFGDHGDIDADVETNVQAEAGDRGADEHEPDPDADVDRTVGDTAIDSGPDGSGDDDEVPDEPSDRNERSGSDGPDQADGGKSGAETSGSRPATKRRKRRRRSAARSGDGVDAEGAVVINFRPRQAASTDDEHPDDSGSDPDVDAEEPDESQDH